VSGRLILIATASGTIRGPLDAPKFKDYILPPKVRWTAIAEKTTDLGE
jgi:hypothetical protein